MNQNQSSAFRITTITTFIITVYALSFPSYALAQDGAFSQNYQNWSDAIGLQFDSLGDLVSALLPYLLVLGGLILMTMLIMGGFQLLTSASNPESAEKGKQLIATAIIGFLLLFAAYWIAQILQVIFGVNFLDTGPEVSHF